MYIFMEFIGFSFFSCYYQPQSKIRLGKVWGNAICSTWGDPKTAMAPETDTHNFTAKSKI
ncbi:MAG: hypothetical protein SWZ49_23370 [Cyanobacteriota bacterium]|nr:hypothetical protein [Cyanobacteriota bacterium]